MKIEIDLYRDWAAYLQDELTTLGYKVAQEKPEKIVHIYLNLLRRLVEPIPRNIFKAKDFSCPHECEAGLAEVERKIQSGQDIGPHLSRKIQKPNFNDFLLNHWGIHHVHLGTTVEDDGFYERTGPVLFVRFDSSAAYFIDVLPHDSWALQRLVRSIHNNWPESIQQYRLNGVVSLDRTLSDDDVARLRKGHVNTMVDLGEGVVYEAIGGGYMTSGVSTEVVIRADMYAIRLREMQKNVVENIAVIADQAEKMNLAFPDHPQFGLQVEDGNNLYAVEINCMLAVPLGKL